MPDLYPGDLMTRLDQLERTVAELQALLGARQPLTAASQGWLMSNMSVPSVSAGTCHIGCNSGDVFSVNASGQVKRMFLQAAATATQDPLQTDVTAPGSYSAAWGQRVRDDLVATRATGFAIQSVLRTAGIMAV